MPDSVDPKKNPATVVKPLAGPFCFIYTQTINNSSYCVAYRLARTSDRDVAGCKFVEVGSSFVGRRPVVGSTVAELGNMWVAGNRAEDSSSANDENQQIVVACNFEFAGNK